METKRIYRIMISGGGTGGHIYPAISIAQALQQLVHEPAILFVGAKGRMEMKKVPEAGFPIEGLWIGPLQRKLSVENLLFPLKVMVSLAKSWKLISRFKPDVVVGVGGYASGPLLYVAALRGIPTLLQEQNSYAGLTNKWLAKRAKKICVAHESMEKYFPKQKLVVTGNPVRHTILLEENKKQEAFEFFGFSSDKKTVLSVGGSLGARTLNEAMLAGLEKFQNENVQVIWQTGGFYFEEMKNRTSEMDMTDVKLVDFLKEMHYAYLVADVVVSRAGALAIAELELTGKATVLVPSPNVAEDHQTLNAKALEVRGAAILLRDTEAKEKLADVVLSLLNDTEKRNALSGNILKMARPDAAKDIAMEVIKLVA
jgi:UDP-N-acetylglucosamine--N-acetylmuramyl-(pentapeptide) pyrophosphoryl-undecaprenol N-acetylglucosamine transferase